MDLHLKQLAWACAYPHNIMNIFQPSSIAISFPLLLRSVTNTNSSNGKIQI